MTRIGTLGANTAYVQRILDIQERTNTEQTQVSTGLKSQDYTGIAADANTLINFQNEETAANQYIQGNNIIGTKLSAASTALTGIQTTITNFKKQLATFNQGNTTNQTNVQQIQTFAFQTMLDVQSYLGANIDGQYLFSGGRTNTDPVQLPSNTLGGFQAIYDGANRSWPTNRSAQMLNTTVPAVDTAKLFFDKPTGIVSAASAASLTPFASSGAISVTNSVSNNTTYQVHSHAAMNVGGTPLVETNGAGSGSPTISYGSTPTQILPAASGDINFAFLPDGNLAMTPTTANSLANMTAGTKFTLNGSTAGGWDGAFKVVSNINGTLEIATDSDQAKSESITQTAATAPLSLSRNYGAATALTTGTIAMTATPSAVTGKTTVTITAAGPSDFAAYAVGNTVTIGGSADHNGTFTVTARTGNSISFDINDDALRVSKFLPQTSRTDVTMSFNTGTTLNPNIVQVTNAGGSAGPGYGQLSFSPTGTTGERISGTNGANSFKDASGNPYPPVGAVIQLTSVSGVNDGAYTITANNGSNIEIASTMVTTEAVTSASVTSSSWYQGDTLQIQHRIDDNRQVDVGIYASDPSLEKAMRAMGLIAQGAFGTAGGLDQNQKRINQAMYLLNDGLNSSASGTPPFGTEMRGDLNGLQQNLGFTQKVILDKNSTHQSFIGFLGTRIANIENMDQTTATTNLLSDSNALQASYQALAKVQSLSLINYIK